MKRSTRSFAKEASNLYQSIRQQLNRYAPAAVLAVVSVLAFTQPSDAKIVYTPANVLIWANSLKNYGYYNLDLNHDGVTDFLFTVQDDFRLGFCWGRAEADVSGNGVVGAPLNKGAQIGHGQSFVGGKRSWPGMKVRCTSVLNLMAVPGTE
jgi:hypothetical protein